MIEFNQQIGVTETDDAGLNLSWESKLRKANILITKEVNDNFIEAVMRNENYKSIIIHATVTGWGGTAMEPGVPRIPWSHMQINKLIENGFPVSQLVLRIDPIIPSSLGLKRVRDVLGRFSNTGISRVRVSILDLYYHTKQRIQSICQSQSTMFKSDYRIPYWTFNAPEDIQDLVAETLESYQDCYYIDTCNEGYLADKLGIKPTGCVSQNDLEILGITDIKLEGQGRQRKGCMCPNNKVQLLGGYHGRCKHNCAYCYIKD